MTLVDRFWIKVEQRGPAECWPWLASTSHGGYGKIWDDGKRHCLPAYRVAYELEVGPIPEGYEVDHLCRNPKCVNPLHLEAVTPQENVLRSAAPTAENARKTHCPRGHAYDAANTGHRPSAPERRRCRTCDRERTQAWNARVAAARGALRGELR